MNTTIEKKQFKIERYGLEAVPKELRQTKWYEYASLQAAFAVNAGNFLVPAFAVLQGGLSITAAIISTTIGAALAFLLVSFLSIPGAQHGIPAQYAMRSILGVQGAQWISSPIRSLTSLYWFSVQVIGGAYVIQEVVLSSFRIHIPFPAITLVLSSLMIVLSLIGFDAVKSVTKKLFPVLFIGQTVMLVLFIRSEPIVSTSQTTDTSSSFFTMIFFASLAFMQYVSGVSASSDMTRYAKSIKHGFYGVLIGNVWGFFVTAILGAFSAGLFQHVNPYVAAMSLTNSKWVIFFILLCTLLSMISINLSNAYTGGLSLLNSFPALGRVKASLLFGAFALMLSMLPQLVNEAKTYIALLGAFIVPLSSVIVADFLLIKKMRFRAAFSKEQHRFHIPALVHLLAGVIVYFLIPEAFSPGFITFLFVFISYGVFHPFLTKAN
ncbi:purine-cytosine permease family protein [Metabacillus iocasae]|uniref:Cytosine permease n=1 Tax=Priestia iocasae TaxID=2291674 RepID=A0ABS2QXE5_9BACI|nr:cytosine permease [Metabacillus iocasae]MBM7704140.1 cytosine permease [Metabacillus iocasae]